MVSRPVRCIAVVVLALTVGVLDATSVVARAPGVRTFRSGCGPAVRRMSASRRGLPVLFVHGFAGAPSDFRRRLAGRASMLSAVRGLEGVVAYTFDYSAHSLEWVTDPDIGPALGRAIVCIADEQGEPVTVVAHSMGGLATREAQGLVVGDVRVADAVARVITIGTPFHGAQLLGFADGPAGDVLSSVVGAALRVCDTEVGTRPRRSFCDLLGAAETAAVQGMIPGSDQLAELPRWADGIRIVPMAAEIEAGIDGPFGFSEQFSIGDFAVSVDSALADASRGIRTFVAACHASLFGLVSAIDASPCSHANELANRRIVHQVRGRLERAAARASGRRAEAVGESVEAQRSVPEDRAP